MSILVYCTWQNYRTKDRSTSCALIKIFSSFIVCLTAVVLSLVFFSFYLGRSKTNTSFSYYCWTLVIKGNAINFYITWIYFSNNVRKDWNLRNFVLVALEEEKNDMNQYV